MAQAMLTRLGRGNTHDQKRMAKSVPTCSRGPYQRSDQASQRADKRANSEPSQKEVTCPRSVAPPGGARKETRPCESAQPRLDARHEAVAIELRLVHPGITARRPPNLRFQ